MANLTEPYARLLIVLSTNFMKGKPFVVELRVWEKTCSIAFPATFPFIIPFPSRLLRRAHIAAARNELKLTFPFSTPHTSLSSLFSRPLRQSPASPHRLSASSSLSRIEFVLLCVRKSATRSKRALVFCANTSDSHSAESRVDRSSPMSAGRDTVRVCSARQPSLPSTHTLTHVVGRFTCDAKQFSLHFRYHSDE